MKIQKGAWVIVHSIVLEPHERAAQVPDDTKQVPLEMWVKGFLNEDAEVGESVEITTITNRKVSGKLLQQNPHYEHDYGKCIPEILQIGITAKEILFGGEEVEV